MREFSKPKDVKQVCSFLRLASYYQRFISQLSVINSLYALTKKDVQFSWSDEEFALLKALLTQAPIFAFPNLISRQFRDRCVWARTRGCTFT